MPGHPVAAIGLDMVVAEVMRRWPATLPVFLARKMSCPGCPMAGFMTIDEAARSYFCEPRTLLDELRAAAGAPDDGETR